MPTKNALVLGISDYEDEKLMSLRCPVTDVEELSKVLCDPGLGGFDSVVPCMNERKSGAERAITKLFAEKQHDDLVVFYFSGHGLRDDGGELYLAVKDTDHGDLLGTAIAADFLKKVMNKSGCKRQVLILDCCHSGAFSAGFKGAKAETVGASVGTKMAFDPDGFGRIILTASDATQYAWESEEKIVGEPQTSLYTSFLIDGIRSGEADLSRDGMITVEELHNYVYKRTLATSSKQRPTKICDREQGALILSRAPLHAAALPEAVTSALRSPFASVRQAMVGNLAEMFRNEPAGIAISAYQALAAMVEDDSKAVRQAAEGAIAACRGERMEIDRSLLEAIKLESAGKMVETPGELEALKRKQEEDTREARRIQVEIAAGAEADRETRDALAEAFRARVGTPVTPPPPRVWTPVPVAPPSKRSALNNMDAYIRADTVPGGTDAATASEGKTADGLGGSPEEMKRQAENTAAMMRDWMAKQEQQKEEAAKKVAAAAQAQKDEEARVQDRARAEARKAEELAAEKGREIRRRAEARKAEDLEKQREIGRISRENALKVPEVKPWWRRWWAMALGGFAGLIALRSCASCASSSTPEPAKPAITATEPAKTTEGMVGGEATVGALVFDPPSNVRALATASSGILCSITAKQQITVYATPLKTGGGIWWKTDACGQTGFIAGNQVRVDGTKY